MYKISGDKVRLARAALGKTQDEVAKEAEIKRETLSKIERKITRLVRPVTIGKISKVLKQPIEYFILKE